MTFTIGMSFGKNGGSGTIKVNHYRPLYLCEICSKYTESILAHAGKMVGQSREKGSNYCSGNKTQGINSDATSA